MTPEAKALQEQRNKMYWDYYNNITPERMPVWAHIPMAYVAWWAKQDYKDVAFDFTRVREAIKEIDNTIYSDEATTYPPAGEAPYVQALGSKTRVQGPSGFIQHPDVSGMNADEYDYFIEDPLACIIERFVPRLFDHLNPEKPIDMFRTALTADKINMDIMMQLMPTLQEISEEHGYYSGAPMGSGAFCLAPCDFVADQCRGFSNFSTDVRRMPGKIKDACEAIYPYLFTVCKPANPDPRGMVSTPLHMPPFMREKDFVELWVPTYKRLLEEYASIGVRVSAFLESDWTRFLDIIKDEFPCGTRLYVEKGDPKTFKDKLGDKFLLAGMYSLENLRSYSKEQAIDNLKELLDIVMPGCGYTWGFSAYPIGPGDIQLENYIAITEYLRDNAKYDNPGQPFGKKLNSENFQFDLSKSAMPKSKYSFNWEEYKAANPYAPDYAKEFLEAKDIPFAKYFISLFF